MTLRLNFFLIAAPEQLINSKTASFFYIEAQFSCQTVRKYFNFFDKVFIVNGSFPLYCDTKMATIFVGTAVTYYAGLPSYCSDAENT